MPDEEPPKTETSIALSSDAQTRDMIYTVRGQQAMLDSDLAELHEVETKALNRAAKRNEHRFPEDFRFKLTREELGNLRCQIGTLAGQDTDPSIGRTYLPHVHTEQGVAMLSSVPRSKVAINHRCALTLVVDFPEERSHVVALRRKTIQFPLTMYRYPVSMPLSARSAVPTPGTSANSCAFPITESTRRLAAMGLASSGST